MLVSGHCIAECDKAPRDAESARSAVCFEDIAINCDGSWPEGFEVNDGTEAASDQSLDLGRATVNFAPLAKFPG